MHSATLGYSRAHKSYTRISKILYALIVCSISFPYEWNLFLIVGYLWHKTEKCSEQICLKPVLNVDNLFLARYLNRTSYHQGPGPGGGWTSGHDWIWGLLDLFLHLIKNATEADIYRAGKACVRRGAGKCCGRCCGCNGRRGWWSWRYGSSCRTAEAAEGEDPAGSLYRGWYVHLLSLSFVLSLSLFLSDALALPCSLFFFLCLFFPDIS